MTRTIHLITAKSTSYSSETIIVAAFASKHEADDVMAMIESCQPGKRLEVVPVELRGTPVAVSVEHQKAERPKLTAAE